MNKAFLFTILLLTSHLAFAQKIASKIDSLHTNAEVENLIRSVDKEYKEFKLKAITEFTGRFDVNNLCKRTADSLNITQSFYKADFDNNGYTDLLAIGTHYEFAICVVMNYGDDSLTITKLTRSAFQGCTFPKIVNDSLVRYYYRSDVSWRPTDLVKPLQFSDLIFKYGDFVEYNPQPKKYSIEKIEYQTTMCYGHCPQFFMGINKDRSAIFKAQKYNRAKINIPEINGTFTTTINEQSYAAITNLLNYIDFPNLNDDYEVNWTDDQSCTLLITYNNGQVKKINDYGLKRC